MQDKFKFRFLPVFTLNVLSRFLLAPLTAAANISEPAKNRAKTFLASFAGQTNVLKPVVNEILPLSKSSNVNQNHPTIHSSNHPKIPIRQSFFLFTVLCYLSERLTSCFSRLAKITCRGVVSQNAGRRRISYFWFLLSYLAPSLTCSKNVFVSLLIDYLQEKVAYFKTIIFLVCAKPLSVFKR